MSSKKQISILLGHAVTIPANSSGGVEKVFEEIFNKWDDENFEYNLICRNDPKKDTLEIVSPNKKILFLKGYKWSTSKFINVSLSFFWCVKAIKYLRQSDFVIYNSVFGPLLHKIFRLKGLASYCDQRGTGKVSSLIPNFTLDRLYAISRVVQNSWNKNWYFVKIKIIPNCVDIDLFRFIERYKSANKNYSILFVGRIINEKGLLLLLEAIKILSVNYKLTNVSLKIIGPFEAEKGGDPLYYEKCREYVVKYKLDNNIEFLGERNSNEILNYLSGANILAMSSIWEEAFGIVNIEALATGLPIVGFNKGALEEIIKNNEEGFIVEKITPQALADGIFTHCNLSVEEKAAMERRCRRKAEQYDSKRIAELYLTDIKELLA